MKINKKIASSVAGASVVLTLLGIFSKGVGFFREIIFANNFGLSPEFDLFLTSIALPNVINTAVLYLCQHYFLPAYNKIKKESEETSIDFLNYTFWWFVLGGVVVAVFLYFTSGLILNSYLASISYEMQQKGLKIFLLFLITIPINAGMSVIIAYQQANFKFIYPAFSLIVLNIVVIILIVFFSDLLLIFILPISFVAAYIAAFIILYSLVRKNLKFISLKILKMRFNLSKTNVIISLIIIEGLSLSFVLIDRYFIGRVSEGGIAALNYAFVIYSLPISLFSFPLITTMFSKFSSLSVNLPEKLRVDFKRAVIMNMFIIIPFIFILYFWGDFFLRLFYERGKFTGSDTLMTYSVLQYYSFSLIFISGYSVVVKILYSINKYHIILMITVVAFLLKVFLSFMFVDGLGQNGLALSTSLTYLFLFAVGFYSGMKLIQMDNKFFHVNSLLYYVINALVSYLITYLAFYYIDVNYYVSDTLSLTMFLLVYALNSFVLKDEEFGILSSTILKMLNRK